MLRTLLILAGVFFVILIVSGSLATWLGGYFEPGSRECYLAQSAVQALVAFVGTAIVTARLATGKPWIFLGVRQRVSVLPFIGVVIVYLLAMPFLNQLIYYNTLMTFPSWLEPVETFMREMEETNAAVTAVMLHGTSVWDLVSGILVIGVLTGLGEEFLFRGTLQRALDINPRMGQWAIWIAAFIFSAVHLQFYGFLPRLLLGAFFGYLLYSTGSIWPGVFAHALNNSIVVASAWLQQRHPGWPEAEKLGVATEGFPVVATVSLLLSAGFLIIFYRRFFFILPNRKPIRYGL